MPGFPRTLAFALICSLAATPALAQEEIAELLASDGAERDQFGRSCAVLDGLIVIGAPGMTNGSSHGGKVYVYTEDADGDWIESAILTPSDAALKQSFGFSVAVHGETIVVGAPHHDGACDPPEDYCDSGAVYVFRHVGEAWIEEAILTPTGIDEYWSFGGAVAIDDGTIIAGAPTAATQTGLAFVFEFDGSSWTEQARLEPGDPDEDEQPQFGFSVGISGNRVLIGAPYETDYGVGSGSAYAFVNSGGWGLEQKIFASDAAPFGFFGISVSLDGDSAVIGSRGVSGTAYVYSHDGGSWGDEVKLVSPEFEPQDRFGAPVVIVGAQIVVGAWGDDQYALDSGAAHVFERTDGSWSHIAKLKAAVADPHEWLGEAVASDGRTFVLGAPAADDQLYTGIAHVFGYPDTDTDGDGLLDTWETDGIPYTDSDGNEWLYVLDVDGDGESDADPNHKDLFVELDMMSTLSFPQAAVDEVVNAFWAAPVPNPDGDEGITLHIVVDEDTIQFEETTETPGDSWPTDAADLRAFYFGTVAEQFDPDAAALLEAKAKAYRYCILYNKASGGMGGLGEIGGDDFVIFAGTYGDENKAAVFMHELGHNLNLDHGGGDDINGKPNYPSIMNYVHSYRETWNKLTWKLDYSRERLATLNENALDEPVGIGLGGSGYYADFLVPYFTVVTDGADCFYPNEWNLPAVAYTKLSPANTQDYNLDCDKDDTDLTGDLNHLDNVNLPGSGDPSPGETLEGHDDWAEMVLPVSDGGGAFAGTVPSDELTEDQRALINEIFPRQCTGDWDVDGLVNTQDFLAYLNDWAAGNRQADLNADGVVNTQDFIAFLNAWVAGCP